MQCQICNKNDATIHLTEIADGVRAEMHVCESCAQEQGIAVKSQIPLNELLSSLLAVQPSDEELFGSSEKDSQTACPHCGFTLEKFRKEAVLGCPYDYEVFEKSLLQIIKKAHNGNTAHCGKVPSNASSGIKKQTKLVTLRRKLEEAVRSEDYELAAKLRDKIKKLES
jgi:protein arginine kinase activator